MKNNVKHLIAFLSIPFFLASCTASDSNLQQVVNQHSQAIQQLQAQVSGVQPAQADNWSQVQALHQEMADVKGSLDNLNNSTVNLGGIPQLGTIIARHDKALRIIETQLALNLGLNSASATNVYDQKINQNTTAASQNNQAVTTPTSTLNTTPDTNTTDPVSPAKPNITDTAQALYDSGINDFNDRNYANALNSFLDFTQVYPEHKLISNAWFWQGESHYQMKNYAAAALAYEKVINAYPNSIKAPASYLKQGMAFLALKRNDAAKERLNHLVSTYPKAPEAKRAEQVLKTL